MHVLANKQFERAEFRRSVYVAEIPHGTPLSALLEPDYWRHVAAKLKKNDIIEAFAADGGFDVELRVIEAQPTYAKVRIRKGTESSGLLPGPLPDVVATSDYRVKWRGPNGGWSVIDKSNAVVASKLPSEEAAHEALNGFLAAKAA